MNMVQILAMELNILTIMLLLQEEEPEEIKSNIDILSMKINHSGDGLTQ